MQKILVICGPTATGKTALALHLAKIFGGELISADSRQVYHDMDIVTGKDLPEDGVKVWLADLADPQQEFSVAVWRKQAERAINTLKKEKKLPIVVGGTGLYIKSLIENIETLNIPRNKNLRKQLEDKTVEELFNILAQLDSTKAASLNHSDKNNPRRLVRAIEAADWGRVNPKRYHVLKHDNRDFLLVGLIAPLAILDENINRRVDERVKAGAIEEIKELLSKGVTWKDQAMSAIGYAELKNYFEGKTKLTESIEKWKRAERQYAKRQLTWLKKNRSIKWFDITETFWQDDVVKLVRAWYNQEYLS